MTKDSQSTRPILTLGSFKKNDSDHVVTNSKLTLALSKQQPQEANKANALPVIPAVKKNPAPKVGKEVAILNTNPTISDQEQEVAKKSQPKSFINNEDYQLILGYMREHYPKCFPTTAIPLPLAIGIHEQLFAIPDLPFSKMKIRKFLGKYTKSYNYRQQLIIGNDRMHLDGSIGSKILEVEIPKWMQTTNGKKMKDACNK
jgi:hypothetical protein